MNLLKAANVIASKEETRYYLQGVFIEATHERVFYVATDGHRLVAFHHAAEWNGDIEEKDRKFSVLIPSKVINGIKLYKAQNNAELKYSEGDMSVIKQADGSIFGFEMLDATFPDWRCVVPEETNGKVAQFNGDYLASFKKVGRIIGVDNTIPGVYHNGDGPALIDLGMTEYDYVACIMPMRCSATHNQKKNRPDWVKAR